VGVLLVSAHRRRQELSDTGANAMAWTTPKFVEICIGMEVTGYESAGD
jgi:coenzyme PQQ precursor peptide PqqA